MPGKFIDRTVLTIISALAAYLFFLNAWGSIPLACASAFVFCILLKTLVSRRPVRFRCTLAEAEAELLRIASMSDSDTYAAIEALVRKKYPDEEYILAPVAKHPTSGISSGDIFAQWKKHRGSKRLLIAATCGCDPRAVMYARELSEPQIAVLDRRQLLRIIRTNGVPEGTAPEPLLRRLKRVPAKLTAGRSGPKNAFFGCVLTGIYLLTGNPLYLLSGLFSLFLFGCSIPSRCGRKRLFP